VVEARATSDKPLMLSFLGDTSILHEGMAQAAREGGVVLTRSSDRMLRALGHLIRRKPPAPDAGREAPLAGLPALEPGAAPEWKGKAYLAAAGLKTPAGALVRTADEAAALAGRIGYPVVLKAQAGALAHKTEAGGVILNLRDEVGLRAGWDTLIANVSRAQPGLELDGVLVEAMVGKGVELVVGARRDPQWGPVLLVGLGGVMIEALGDVCLLPADASLDEIVAAFAGLRAARLLQGFRGMAPADVEAAAQAARLVGRLMLQEPRLIEIDVNPLMVHAKGQGATALDALVVAG
jgi:acyl-CoA synthetase (NDP forming)